LGRRATRAKTRAVLFLIRHGRASAGVEADDPGLDELGHAQALATALALNGCGAQRIVASPLRRTRETAAPIGATLGLPVEVRHEVSEVFQPGLSAEHRRDFLDELFRGRWSEQAPALRSWRAGALDALVGLAGGDVIVVSHFVAISAAIGAALEDDRVCAWPVPNASITTIDVRNGKLVLREAGGVSHLGPELVSYAAAIVDRGAEKP
jgi:broad specificity phosphatase PhoE